ncbi:hypothetical protein CAC42_5788 [Sphaceloma murrayae]|uniref:Uncharacterized protein n=1 Tax=Sphaceloma murrayae TaxID=2082308 RepID=A0A2K1QZ69_9PEZI|nr:hypothetical protein CAC42_5788 [Sphaceloma murrayae]
MALHEKTYETCYVFQPHEHHVVDSRPTKRRKTGEYTGLQRSWPRRCTVYQTLWSAHEARLQGTLDKLNSQAVLEVSDFIVNATTAGTDPKIDSAILITGPTLSSQGLLTSQIYHRVKKQTRSSFVSFSSTEATNLKAVLKKVNAVISSRDHLHDDDDDNDEDGGDQDSSARRGMKLLNYDLRIAQQAVEDQGLTKVIVGFQDCEAFDGSLLSDIVELFSYWKDRIPFVLIFGIATTVESLQIKLTRRAIRCIRGRRFEINSAESTLEDVFEKVYTSESRLWFGAGFSQMMTARQRDYLTNPQTIIDTIHYAYMTQFYANAVSVFLDPDLEHGDVPSDHYEAARNLPSFMQLSRDLLEGGKPRTSLVRSLLESDKNLHERIREDVEIGQRTMGGLISAARIFHKVSGCMESIEKAPESEIVLQALSGSLHDSARHRNLTLALKRASSTALEQIFDRIQCCDDKNFHNSVGKLKNRLAVLLDAQEEGDAPLRSEVDIQNSTLRTTVISKKISLSKAKTTLTKADAAYSEILNDFIEQLYSYFSGKFVDPKTLPFNEIFLFDLKSPYRQTFTPRPRHAIERALSSPHDYLNCECCAPKAGEEDEESTLSSSQPPTAVLYQLYLESGLMANAADLKSAFVAILGDKVEDEEVLSALFQRSLAELSYLGLVKSTKKKADHLIKMAWKGL